MSVLLPISLALLHSVLAQENAYILEGPCSFLYHRETSETFGRYRSGTMVYNELIETAHKSPIAADGGYIFEGDMVLPLEKINNAINYGDIDYVNENGFGLKSSSYAKWKNGKVPFVLDDSVKNKVLNVVGFNGPTERAIRKAMKAWEEKTCIQFVERTNEKDYIQFIDGGFGKCYSHVGRTSGKQKISLGFGCFTTGVAIHEIGHALGLYHEQSRPDRDKYVEIVWDNIKEEHTHNFRKYSSSHINSLGSPYDYDSIMHYGRDAFSRWPFQTTIRVKESGASIGQRDHISTQDAWQINKHYGCSIKNQ